MHTSRFAAGLFAVAGLTSFAILGGGDGVVAASATPRAPGIDSLPSPTGPGAAEPNLAVGKKGEVYLSWLEPADSGHALKFATLKDSRWSAPTTIRAGRNFFVNWADFPSIAVLDGGRLAVHWLQKTGKGTYAYAVRIAQSADNGRTWSAPVTPHRDTMPVEHGFVAMWPEKNALGAVWLDSRKSGGAVPGHDGHGSEMMLMSTTVGRDGKLGPEQTIDARTCDCCQNAVAVASSGTIVAYRDRTSDEIRDIYVSRRVKGKWTEGAAVHNDNWKINACPVNGPALAASGRNVAIAWFTGARDTNKVNVAFSTDGGARFGAPIRIDGGQPGGRVGLVLLPDGSALVSWLERTGGDVAAVQARRVTRSGELGVPRTIAASSAARASGVPRIALWGSNVYFAWTVPVPAAASAPGGRARTSTVVRVARATAADFR